MRLVLAGHRGPLTWVRHAGGDPLGVSKNHVKSTKVAVLYCEGSGARLGEEAALPAPTAAAAALPTIVSSLGGSFCVRGTFCLPQARAPPPVGPGYILRPALQPPSSPPKHAPHPQPPGRAGCCGIMPDKSTQLRQAGRQTDTAAAAGCCWLRVCPCEHARVWCYVQVRLVIFESARRSRRNSVCLAP